MMRASLLVLSLDLELHHHNRCCVTTRSPETGSCRVALGQRCDALKETESKLGRPCRHPRHAPLRLASTSTSCFMRPCVLPCTHVATRQASGIGSYLCCRPGPCPTKTHHILACQETTRNKGWPKYRATRYRKERREKKRKNTKSVVWRAGLSLTFECV